MTHRFHGIASVATLSFVSLALSAVALPLPGDVDGSGEVNAVDVQLVINAALGIDISGDLKGSWFEATDAAPFGGRQGHTTVVHNGKLWVIGGDNSVSGLLSDVWYSEDGVNWVVAVWDAPFGPRTGHTSVVYDGKIWVIGGSGNSIELNDVWYSENGIDWQSATLEAPWTARSAHGSVVFDDKLWVIGGVSGGYNMRDVWYSENGADWFPATLEASWPERRGLMSIVFNNRMWIIGERYGVTNFKRDVWYSENGADWLPATLQAPWSEREGAAAVVHNNEIWVIGGNVYDERYSHNHRLLNDAWHSADGATWSQLVAQAHFDGRYRHSCTAFDGLVWLMGGYGDDSYLGDVWYMLWPQ